MYLLTSKKFGGLPWQSSGYDPDSRARAVGLIPGQESRIPLCQKKKSLKTCLKRNNHFGILRASLHLGASDCLSALRSVLQ